MLLKEPLLWFKLPRFCCCVLSPFSSACISQLYVRCVPSSQCLILFGWVSGCDEQIITWYLICLVPQSRASLWVFYCIEFGWFTSTDMCVNSFKTVNEAWDQHVLKNLARCNAQIIVVEQRLALWKQTILDIFSYDLPENHSRWLTNLHRHKAAIEGLMAKNLYYCCGLFVMSLGQVYF